MIEKFLAVALMALGLYLLITSVQAFLGGNKSGQTIVYITIGALLVAYNLAPVTKLLL